LVGGQLGGPMLRAGSGGGGGGCTSGAAKSTPPIHIGSTAKIAGARKQQQHDTSWPEGHQLLASLRGSPACTKSLLFLSSYYYATHYSVALFQVISSSFAFSPGKGLEFSSSMRPGGTKSLSSSTSPPPSEELETVSAPEQCTRVVSIPLLPSRLIFLLYQCC
jgi:hypothetical protein